MNKKFKYIVLSIILFVLVLFPSNNVFATSYKYNSYYVDYSTFTNATLGEYYIASGEPYKFSGSFYIHQITYDNNYFQGYCMHFGKKVNEGGPVSLITDFKNLKDKNGNAVPTERIKILQNILASGYQNGNRNVNGSIVNNNGYRYTTCKSKTVCKNILATQILIWETIEGGRTNYDENPNKLSKNTYAFVKTDSELLQAYKNILKNAKDLSSDVYIPKAFGNTYVLKWNGKEYGSYKINTATNQYEREYIHIGAFKNEKLPDGVKLTPYKDPSTNKIDYTKVYISSSEEINTKLKFNLTKGSTLKSSSDFRWFRFNNFSGQDVLMGDYKKTVSAELTIKTEETKIKLRKVDENGNDLKGATFTVTHCTNTSKCESKPIATVNLSSNAMSGNIDIKKSGYYLISETKVPSGRTRISDFYIYININPTTGGVSYKVSTDAAGLVTVSKEKDTNCLIFNIKNMAKDIKINKVDGSTNTGIKGATFGIIKTEKGKCDGSVYMNFKNQGNGVFSQSNDSSIDPGKIVDSNFSTYTIRGLSEGYYCLVELDVPSPYVLPSGQEKIKDFNKIPDDQKVLFGISKNMNLYVYNTSKKAYEQSPTATINVKNYKSTVEIIKKGKNNTKLKGVEFELYKEDKTSIISLTKTDDGIYNYSGSGDVKTLVTNSNGSIKIIGLPVGTYYMKETKAADGYTIDESVRWKEITVKVTKNGQTSPIGVYEWPNTKGEFCFYKIDEDGKYLSGGLFKLQIFDENLSKYTDIPIIYNNDQNNYSLDVDGKSDVYTFQALKDGQTCFNNAITRGKYKIIEIEAPDGYVLSDDNTAQAEFSVNSEGYVVGNTTIINKKQRIGEGTEAEAELVINISTGQIVMKYGLIIGCILLAIIGLIILNKKMSKK